MPEQPFRGRRGQQLYTARSIFVPRVSIKKPRLLSSANVRHTVVTVNGGRTPGPRRALRSACRRGQRRTCCCAGRLPFLSFSLSVHGTPPPPPLSLSSPPLYSVTLSLPLTLSLSFALSLSSCLPPALTQSLFSPSSLKRFLSLSLQFFKIGRSDPA